MFDEEEEAEVAEETSQLLQLLQHDSVVNQPVPMDTSEDTIVAPHVQETKPRAVQLKQQQQKMQKEKTSPASKKKKQQQDKKETKKKEQQPEKKKKEKKKPSVKRVRIKDPKETDDVIMQDKENRDGNEDEGDYSSSMTSQTVTRTSKQKAKTRVSAKTTTVTTTATVLKPKKSSQNQRRPVPLPGKLIPAPTLVVSTPIPIKTIKELFEDHPHLSTDVQSASRCISNDQSLADIPPRLRGVPAATSTTTSTAWTGKKAQRKPVKKATTAAGSNSDKKTTTAIAANTSFAPDPEWKPEPEDPRKDAAVSQVVLDTLNRMPVVNLLAPDFNDAPTPTPSSASASSSSATNHSESMALLHTGRASLPHQDSEFEDLLLGEAGRFVEKGSARIYPPCVGISIKGDKPECVGMRWGFQCTGSSPGETELKPGTIVWFRLMARLTLAEHARFLLDGWLPPATSNRSCLLCTRYEIASCVVAFRGLHSRSGEKQRSAPAIHSAFASSNSHERKTMTADPALERDVFDKNRLLQPFYNSVGTEGGYHGSYMLKPGKFYEGIANPVARYVRSALTVRTDRSTGRRWVVQDAMKHSETKMNEPVFGQSVLDF